tara:strand:- start:171 stop:371 length:201 start_codon:yes stop_codon:yes gene_type:complete
MSTLHHDELFETCNDMWDIVPCFNGVGAWEVIETDTGAVHETFDTLDEARKVREEYVMDTWEGMLQ